MEVLGCEVVVVLAELWPGSWLGGPAQQAGWTVATEEGNLDKLFPEAREIGWLLLTGCCSVSLGASEREFLFEQPWDVWGV